MTHIGKGPGFSRIDFTGHFLVSLWIDGMARIVATIIFILLIGSIEAPAQETVEQILVQTEEVYRNLQTYHFRGTISYKWMGEDKSIQVPHNSFQSFRGKGLFALLLPPGGE